MTLFRSRRNKLIVKPAGIEMSGSFIRYSLAGVPFRKSRTITIIFIITNPSTDEQSSNIQRLSQSCDSALPAVRHKAWNRWHALRMDDAYPTHLPLELRKEQGMGILGHPECGKWTLSTLLCFLTLPTDLQTSQRLPIAFVTYRTNEGYRQAER